MLGTLAEIGNYRVAENLAAGCTVFVSDALALEWGPRGLINLYAPARNERARLDAYVPLLAGIRGERVVMLGAGADSDTTIGRLAQAESELRYVLARAGARLTWTRSLDLPAGCEA